LRVHEVRGKPDTAEREALRGRELPRPWRGGGRVAVAERRRGGGRQEHEETVHEVAVEVHPHRHQQRGQDGHAAERQG
jgi:hypothetical protein